MNKKGKGLKMVKKDDNNEVRQSRQHKSTHLGGWAPQLPNNEYLRKESLKYIALKWWLSQHLTEMPSARLPLKTAYMAYTQWCDLTNSPEVTIQAFNRAISEHRPDAWPNVRKKRTALGILYVNLTLKAWAASLPAPHNVYPPEGCLEDPEDISDNYPVGLVKARRKSGALMLSSTIS